MPPKRFAQKENVHGISRWTERKGGQREHSETTRSSLHPQTTHSTSSSESLLKLRTDSYGVEHQDQDQELHGNSEPTRYPGDQDDAVGQDAAAGNQIEHQSRKLDEDNEDERTAPRYCKRKLRTA